MKILYITAQIQGDGGVQKIVATKTDYFIKNFNYQIHIISPHFGNDLFFDFNKNIVFHFLKLKSGKILKFLDYIKQIQAQINSVQPDCIVVCDFGLKGFSIPLVIKTKVPVVFEAHASKYNESREFKKNFISKITHNLKYKYKNFCASKFDYFIALSSESLNEWSLKNGYIIPNFLADTYPLMSRLESNRVITVARHSYEKGLDRVIKIWRLVVNKYPNWQLEIYGNKSRDIGLEKLVVAYQLEKNISFHLPVKNIQEKYQNSYMCLMTSRSEGFPMTLLEAMSYGLPIVAFDCPIGPRVLIENGFNGYLVPDDDDKMFASRIIDLIENKEKALAIGKNANSSIQKYNVETVMKLWEDFFSKLSN